MMAAIKKPDLGNPPDIRQVAEILKVITGRAKAGPVARLGAMRAATVPDPLTAPLTAEQHNALLADVAETRATLNAILERLQDG